MSLADRIDWAAILKYFDDSRDRLREQALEIDRTLRVESLGRRPSQEESNGNYIHDSRASDKSYALRTEIHDSLQVGKDGGKTPG